LKFTAAAAAAAGANAEKPSSLPTSVALPNKPKQPHPLTYRILPDETQALHPFVYPIVVKLGVNLSG
jgi:hypothetical protein